MKMSCKCYYSVCSFTVCGVLITFARIFPDYPEITYQRKGKTRKKKKER